MPESKVKRYGLETLAIEMMGQGVTEVEIAEALTGELARRGVSDSVSQATVNRFLKPIRDADRIETQKKIRKAVNDRIDSDIELVDEAIAFHAGEARADGTHTPKVRSDFYVRATKIIFEKVKAAMGSDDPEEVGRRLVEEIEKSLDPTLREKIRAIQSPAGAGAISGPH